MVKVANENNVYFAKKGMYDGEIYTFTHRDPKSGELWSDDIHVKKTGEFGKWVSADSVSFKL